MDLCSFQQTRQGLASRWEQHKPPSSQNKYERNSMYKKDNEVIDHAEKMKIDKIRPMEIVYEEAIV